MLKQNISIVIPAFNAGNCLDRLIAFLKMQSMSNIEIIVVDSSSKDNTVSIASSGGAKVILIPKGNFDHGGIRTLAGKTASSDFIIYITQDISFFDNGSIRNIIGPFQIDPQIGAVYGRQIPYPDASPISTHLRMFNYPPESCVKTIADTPKFGIKTPFLSNAFTAYRKSAMEQIGWFKDNLIVSEDTYAGAKLLKAGYKLAYAADAQVYHSHNYSLIEEFRRYFDIGVFHRTENWILKEFGKSQKEGNRYITSELKFLWTNNHFLYFPEFIVRNALKFMGYKLGYHYKLLPRLLAIMISRQGNWWSLRKRKE